MQGRLPRQILLLLALALLPALAAAWLHPRRPDWHALAEGVREITVAEADTLTGRTPALWIDARPAARFEAGHIPGALLLNEDDWDGQLGPFLAAWKPGMPVIVYCDNLDCHSSRQVARRLRSELETADVRVLQGGWTRWREGRP